MEKKKGDNQSSNDQSPLQVEEGNRLIDFDEKLKNFQMPVWYKACSLVFDWCEYNGVVYFASLNYEESERRQKPVFDLAYCVTKAHNNIFLKQRIWSKRFTYATKKRN